MICRLVKRILACMPGKQVGGKLILPFDLPESERQIVRGVVAGLVELDNERRRLEALALEALALEDPGAVRKGLEALAAALGYQS